jgi:hypothetical protein
MDDLPDVGEMLSHEEIVKRLEKLFGREMTNAERNIFFLVSKGSTHEGEEC